MLTDDAKEIWTPRYGDVVQVVRSDEANKHGLRMVGKYGELVPSALLPGKVDERYLVVAFFTYRPSYIPRSEPGMFLWRFRREELALYKANPGGMVIKEPTYATN